MTDREPPLAGADKLKDVGESAMQTVLDRVGRGVATVQEKSPLAYDLLESEDAYLVVFDAPGAERSDVQVRFNEGAVEVRIDRFRDVHEGFEMRFPGRGLALDGRAELPDVAAVDPAEASSTLTEHGTLRVRIPKEEGGSVVIEAADEAESDTDAAERTDDDPVSLDVGDAAGEEAEGVVAEEEDTEEEDAADGADADAADADTADDEA